MPLASSECAITLIVCRTYGALAVLDRRASVVRARTVVVASDDGRVHREAQRRWGVRDTVFFEQNASMFTVAADVKRTLAALNDWLRAGAVPGGARADLLYWPSHTEGGDATQRIQDALLLLRSFDTLLEKHQPAELWIVEDATPQWENTLLEARARAADIPITWVPAQKNRVALAARMWWATWRPLAKEVVFSARVVAAHFRRLRYGRPQIDDARSVLIQLCDSATKHLNHTIPLMEAIGHRGLQGVVGGWNAASAVRKLRRHGLTAFEFEAWVPVGAIVGSWWRAWRSWRAARRRFAQFLPPRAEAPYEALLRPILWASIRSFHMGELPQRLRLDVACRAFFATHQPRAARLWTRVLPQAVTAFRAMPPEGGTLLFWQPGWAYNVPEPLRDYPVRADLIFALSREHTRVLVADGASPSQVVVAGLPWLEVMHRFARDYAKSASREHLGIPLTASPCVLFDPSSVARGYLSPVEQEWQVRTLLAVASRHPEMHLVVKPHPAHRPGALEAAVAEYSLPNVTYVRPTGPTYHALNAADVLVTKASTLAIEGMCLDVQTIVALFDREEGFKVYEDAVNYAETPEALEAALERLTSNPAEFSAWREDLRARSLRYLAKHGLELDTNPNEVIADVLAERLASLPNVPCRAQAVP